MYPTTLASTCAISARSRIEFPQTAGWKPVPLPAKCIRVILRGGHFYDLPPSTPVQTRPSAQAAPMSLQTPGNLLPVPCALAFKTSNAPSAVPYDYLWSDNRGASHRASGTTQVSPMQAELLGWLVGDGSLHADRQAIRFANTEASALHRVQLLTTKGFPGVRVGWYPKTVGYDLTLTGGINNPLRHFIRMMDFYQGCPMAVGRHFTSECAIAFLRGLWGADGWLYVRKGGNDVVFGLARTSNEYLFSWLRLLHAGVGLQGARETDKHGSSRLVFNGYANYAVFMRVIGQIGQSSMPASPVRRSRPAPATFLANGGEMWYDAPIVKVLNLPKPVTTYRFSPCLTPNMKPIQGAARKT